VDVLVQSLLWGGGKRKAFVADTLRGSRGWEKDDRKTYRDTTPRRDRTVGEVEERCWVMAAHTIKTQWG